MSIPVGRAPRPIFRLWITAGALIYGPVDAWLSRHVWNVWHAGASRGLEWQKYAKRNIERDRKTVRMHREIMIAADPRSDDFLGSHFVDHINGQTLDNRRENLRWATKAQNNINRRARGTAPSLDAIALQLMAEHGYSQPQEVPF